MGSPERQGHVAIPQVKNLRPLGDGPAEAETLCCEGPLVASDFAQPAA